MRQADSNSCSWASPIGTASSTMTSLLLNFPVTVLMIFWYWDGSRWIHTLLQLVSEIAFMSSSSALILEGTLLYGGIFRLRSSLSSQQCPLSVLNKYGCSLPSGKEHARSAQYQLFTLNHGRTSYMLSQRTAA